MSKSLKIDIILNAADKASQQFARVKNAASGLSGNLDKLQKELKETNEASRNLDRLAAARGKLNETAQALNQVRGRQKELLAEIRKGGKATKAQSDEMAKLGKQAEKLNIAQSKQRQELNKYSGRLKEAGVSTSRFADAQRKLAQRHKDTEAAIKKETAAMERLAKIRNMRQSLSDTSSRMAGVGLAAGAHAAVIGRGMMAPVKAYADTETAGTDLRVAMMDSGGKVGADYQEIDALATRLGNKLPGTTADFKNLMTMLVRQGMSTKAILGGTGEAAALLAVQLKKTPEAAAEMAAKLQDATRGSEKEMTAIMDQVQRLFYSGVDDSNILGAFSKLAPALDLMKVKGEEAMKMMAPLVGMLDQSGLVGESAGNALRKVFDRTLDQKKIEKATKGTGISLDFTDGKGNFGGMEKVYAELEKLKGLSDVQKRQIISGIWGDDAETMQALNVMIDKGLDGYKEFEAKLAKQASLKQRVDAQLGTLQNLWDAASGTFTNFLVSMGEAIAPELKALTEWIGGVAEKMQNWAAQNPALANTLMKVAAGAGLAFAVIAAGALVIHGFVAAFSLVFGAVGTVIGIFSKLRMAFVALKVVMALNPITLFAMLAIGALILLWRNWDTVKAALIKGWEWIKKVFRDNPLLAAFTGPIGAIVGLIANFDRLISKAKQVKNALSNMSFSGAASWVGSKIKSVAGFSSGGYTGAGGVNEAAGIVHRGEVVFSQRDVAKFGGWRVVEALRRGGMAALNWGRGKFDAVQSFASGQQSHAPSESGRAAPTLVGAVPVPANFSRSVGHTMPMNISINISGGGSPVDIAREVARQIEDLARQQARRARSAFFDKD
ncbi:phage tail tape measure protein [Neisseria sp. N95_16]|uniref:Phage tail tape measure protein n=1 Tax=Neisseria brasiliensis TaxID=2666100 RepID=A0A5Q3RUV1_9NEIS|nr:MULTISPECIES: phage tail tape measure protein [Neisseria]MRN37213.1 phage tail tape measure protein [Neisseria brasiliensis]PJO09236.1 phage tail tape measure protein [Neisseria sp. N95_16]PJO77107.1 phage tail tape measure protein [Neisseria sp. N177_16]QGL24222.1 phage tail tape measure protein [Neisseria brasiliensis]